MPPVPGRNVPSQGVRPCHLILSGGKGSSRDTSRGRGPKAPPIHHHQHPEPAQTCDGSLDGRMFTPARRARSACAVCAGPVRLGIRKQAAKPALSALDSSGMVKSTKALSTAKRSPACGRAGFPFALPCVPGAVPVGRLLRSATVPAEAAAVRVPRQAALVRTVQPTMSRPPGRPHRQRPAVSGPNAAAAPIAACPGPAFPCRSGFHEALCPAVKLQAPGLSVPCAVPSGAEGNRHGAVFARLPMGPG